MYNMLTRQFISAPSFVHFDLGIMLVRLIMNTTNSN